MYDDNIHDVTSHMRMLHGDVISKTHGPGVNLFKPAADGRRFWVSAKSGEQLQFVVIIVIIVIL